MLPYTAETLFALFDEYNRAIRPLLGLALFLAAGVLMLVIRARNDRTKIVLGILAAGCAVDRHRLPVHFFSAINIAPRYTRQRLSSRGCC